MMKYNDPSGWDNVFDLTYTLQGAQLSKFLEDFDPKVAAQPESKNTNVDKLSEAIDNLRVDLSNNTDYILSNLRQDAIIERSKAKEDLDAVKDLILTQSEKISRLTRAISEQKESLSLDMKDLFGHAINKRFPSPYS
ncbi:hypothetical protein KEM48_003603 [Puccinia striiformis f. sp. tritici PST-130]|nr:hypothetical protein KEM48_003603 [Puccinia striiformis f. sp. tritici PST-130]